jgi:hypothetical protein
VGPTFTGQWKIMTISEMVVNSSNKDTEQKITSKYVHDLENLG